MKLGAYVRVSRVGDREGDAYRSPTIQRERITAWAASQGVELGPVEVDENVSGGSAVETRKLEKLIVACEKKQLGGIIVYRLDRFGRDLTEVVVAAKRLKDAGARLVAVDDGYDSAGPFGPVMLGLLSGLAEWELDRRRQGWAESVERAVAAGIYPSPTPYGYVKDEKRRLKPDPEHSKVVLAAFKARAAGKSYREVGEILAAGRGEQFSKSGVVGVLTNRAYLGEIHATGDVKNLTAHKPLVTPELFAAAQPKVGTRGPRQPGRAPALLVGVAKCAACGFGLRVVGRGNGAGHSYACHGWHAGQDCPSPAAMTVALLDEYVLTALNDSAAEVGAAVVSAEQRYLTAKAAVAAARGELEAYVVSASALDADLFKAGLMARQAKLTAAERELYEAGDAGVPDDASVVYVDGKPWVYSNWDDMTLAQRRAHLRKYVASVTVARADPKRRRWQPIAERIEIRWRAAQESVASN